MRTFVLDLDGLIAAFNGQERLEHFLDLESGQLLAFAPRESESEARREMDADSQRYAAVPPLDLEQRIALREAFLLTLQHGHAHPMLVAALASRKPLRRFDYELDLFPAVRDAWQAFEAKQLRELALQWLAEQGVEPAPERAPLDTRGIPRDILRRLTKGVA